MALVGGAGWRGQRHGQAAEQEKWPGKDKTHELCLLCSSPVALLNSTEAFPSFCISLLRRGSHVSTSQFPLRPHLSHD